MRLKRLDNDTILLSQLNPLCCGLLRQIVSAADPGDSDAARERLFSSPTHGTEPDFDLEWKEYVEPDLHDLFRRATEIVAEDLKSISESGRTRDRALRIPVKHLEAWVHALNQARLALAARHGFDDEEMSARLPMVGEDRALALFQVHFYGFIQECLLREIE